MILSSACDLGEWMPQNEAWSTFRSGDATDLALHPRQAADETGAILRIRMTEMIRLGAGRRLAFGLGHGRPPSL